MDNFESALAFALQWEGGFVNHPNDKGGATNRGITTATYNAYRRSRNLTLRSVRLLEEHELQTIYRQNYWDRTKCSSLPKQLAIAHFDWAINAGVSRAIKTFQAIVGVEADGIWGPLTDAGVANALKIRGEAEILRKYLNEREACYRRWGVGSQAVFLRGWLNRLSALRGYLA